MKKLIAILFIAFLVESCDKVPSRIPPVKPDCVLDSSVVVINTNTSSNLRKVLLEDYTGHRCGNCPPAIEQVDVLIKKYPRLIVVANHVTETYAAPLTTKYKKDLRDPASKDWDENFFKISNNGLPVGSVNRKLVTSSSYRMPYADWDQNIAIEMAKPQTVKLNVTTYYDTDQKILNVKVLSTFKAAMAFNVNITMLLTMDSLISDQTDYGPPAGAVVIDNDRRPDFVFDHFMVKSLNGTWGQLLKTGPIAANDTVSVRKDCNYVSKCFYKNELCTDDTHMYLVVFVYNETTKEVLQVEKVKIIPEKE